MGLSPAAQLADANEWQGLSRQQAEERMAADGPNELPSAQRRTLLAMLLGIVREPMFLLLLACGALYLLLGDIEEALMLLGFVGIVIGIALYQEQKTERAIEALRDLSSPRALVIRDGQQQRIAGREVVRDDILLLAEGDRVPADAAVLAATNLRVDESLLTGESVPVAKSAGDGQTAIGRPGGDGLPFVFSGTLVVSGQAVTRALATGPRAELGRIGASLLALKPERTNLQVQTGKIVKTFAIAGLFLCAVVVVVYGLTRGNWLNGILAGLTLAMATLPEEFPVVLTVFLALGAWRLAQRQVLTRSVPAVEMLGAATVLCVDKTGTLTANRMTVTHIAANGDQVRVGQQAASLPESAHEVVEYSLLASPADPFDPMEKAMKELGERTLANTEHLHHDWELIREYPLSPELLAMSRVWRSPNGQDYVIAAKGSPEAVADLCHLSDGQWQAVRGHIDSMASEGLRVIGVAKANFQPANLPQGQHDFPFEFAGLLGLTDPVRPEVPAAVEDCGRAGIRIIMITGDHPETARSIARQIGLPHPDEIITGPELEAMDSQELQRRLPRTNIFARTVPEQKLLIVQALKEAGEVVAMTGDGVNDAPALKAAHIGIAMGKRGTDVAREAAALVLLDDNFASIVHAVRLGRRIFDNLKKAMTFIFSVHIPIVGMSLLPVLFKWPLILYPIHVLFLEMIIDPACTLVFEVEGEEDDVMRRPPRALTEPLFGRLLLLTGLFQGLGVLVVVLAAFLFSLHQGFGDGEARMMAFGSLVLGNLALIFSNRYQRRSIWATLAVPNKALWGVTGGTLFFLSLVLSVPFLRRLFQFGHVHSWELALILVAGLASALLSECVKLAPVQRLLARAQPARSARPKTAG